MEARDRPPTRSLDSSNTGPTTVQVLQRVKKRHIKFPEGLFALFRLLELGTICLRLPRPMSSQAELTMEAMGRQVAEPGPWSQRFLGPEQRRDRSQAT